MLRQKSLGHRLLGGHEIVLDNGDVLVITERQIGLGREQGLHLVVAILRLRAAAGHCLVVPGGRLGLIGVLLLLGTECILVGRRDFLKFLLVFCGSLLSLRATHLF